MRVELLLALLIVSCWALPRQAPVIGVFTLPNQGDEPHAEDQQVLRSVSKNETYFAASYVKFIQMSGAQVVPILSFSDQAYFDNLLPKLNGVLFTGGSYLINIKNKWTQNADYVFKYALNENKKGNPFPVWGTCLGWQLLAYLTSGYDTKTLSPVQGEAGLRKPLKILQDGYIYSGMSDSMKYNLQNGDGITYFNHINCVSTDFFNSNTKIKSFWNLISTTKSSFNQEFISTAEGKEFPVFGVQYHPEKNLFEWKVKADRSNLGAQLVQILSNKFVEIARKNQNSFSSQQDFRKEVIYNYKTHFTTMSFTQIYIFSENVQHPQQYQENELPNLMTQ